MHNIRKFQVCKQVCVYVMYLFFVSWWWPAFGFCICKFTGSCVCLHKIFVIALASCVFIGCFIASCTDGLFLRFVSISVCIVYFIVCEYGWWFHYFFRMQKVRNKGMTSGRWRNTYGWEMAGLVVLNHTFIKKYRVIVIIHKYY